MFPSNPISAVFRVGDLVRFRRYDVNPEAQLTIMIPIWDSPADYKTEECWWVPGDAVSVIIGESHTSYRILTAEGRVGWVDTWDLELV